MALQSRLPDLSHRCARPTPPAIDAGLRAYMLRVYNWMASGLVLTGLVAYGIANTSADRRCSTRSCRRRAACAMRRARWPSSAMFAPLAFALVLSFGINRLSTHGGAGHVLGVLRRDGRQPDERSS